MQRCCESGCGQPELMPAPTHSFEVGSSIVLGPHFRVATQWPPTIRAPPSRSQGIELGCPSTGTHCSEPSLVCTCLVPGPQVEPLQLAAAMAPHANRNPVIQRFIPSPPAPAQKTF